MRVRDAMLVGFFGAMVTTAHAEIEVPVEPVPAELLEFLLEWQDEQGEPVDPDMLDVSPSLAPASADD